MDRIGLALLFCAGSVLAGGVAQAQCHGGAVGQGTASTTIGALAGLAGSGGQMFNRPGSYANQVMMSQMIAQQAAQQRYMLAMQQQQLRQEKLAERRYRAEQHRAKAVDGRARTRAALAAQSGLPKGNGQSSELVAYQSNRR